MKNDETKSNMQTGNQQNTDNSQPSAADKSNISVDNQGRIGKAHDQWNNKGQTDRQEDNGNRNDNPVKNDRTVTEPEIDAPIYEPEKTEHKIPQMENKENNK